MKKTPIYAALALIGASMIAACEKDSTIGSSIVTEQVGVYIDSSFTVVGRTVPIEKVQSRTSSQLLGRIDAKDYGRLSSDVVTQFMPSSQFVTDGATVDDIDSLNLYLYVAAGDYVGDSVAPMGVDVYRLSSILPSPIYSDFNPDGYYNPADKLGSAVYNMAVQSADSVISSTIQIKVAMPRELGQELFAAYLQNRDNFVSPTLFAENVFKGVYMRNSFGSGRFMRVSATTMSLFYHRKYFNEDKQRDTVVNVEGKYFAVTPEIISNNDIDFEASTKLSDMVAAGRNIVVAPVGYSVELSFPAPEVIASFRSLKRDLTVLNSLTLSIPAAYIDNDIDLVPPTYLLLILNSKKDEFFAKNQLPDNVTSFYATYNASTSSYNFGEMRSYLLDLLDKDQVTADDYTFSILPVSASFETSSSYYNPSTTLTLMTPYVDAPCMTELYLDRAQVKLTYSTQEIK